LSHFVYLDEAGVANPENDPHVVVLGAIIHGDKQWKKIERHLASLVQKHIRPEHRTDFYFHAKELRYGSKRIPRDSYSRQQQDEIFRDICSIPLSFGVPLICAYVDRAATRLRHPNDSIRQLTENAQVGASLCCAVGVERFMRHTTPSEEMAIMVFENTDKIRKTIKQLQNLFRKPEALDGAIALGFDLQSVLPLSRIGDAPFFAEKTDASMLQVADFCAFATKRHLAGQDSDKYFECIKNNFFLGPVLAPL
jgi:hypothetical protein